MKYRALWGAAIAGLAIHSLGLGWDVYRHSSDSTLAQREDVLSLGNPSHLMIVVGMAIVAASLLGMAALWMNDRKLGGTGLAGLMVRGISLPVISVAAAGSIWLASTAEDSGHEHGLMAHEHAPGTPEEHPHDALAADAADPNSADAIVARIAGTPLAGAGGEGHTHPAATTAAVDNPMGEGENHTHGTEVNVTAEQMIAAGQFANEVKEKTAQFKDIRAAMAAGYVQITPDLPGIAAHFYRADLANDGIELDADLPETLLYSKRMDGNWKLVGVMFMAEEVSDIPPQYFGALDVWHRHENLCFTAGAAVRTTKSAAECVAGVFVAKTAYQMHVWVEPGGNGVFAHDYAPIAPGAFPGAAVPAASELRVQAR